MTQRRKLPHIACYDIADPRRLQRIHRYLKGIGIPLQYSVFLLYLNRDELVRIVDKLERLIDSSQDDVRLYPLPRKPDWLWWGRPLMPDGFHLPGLTLPQPAHMLHLKIKENADARHMLNRHFDITT